MKKLFLIVLFSAFIFSASSVFSLAQNELPAGINYQAVAREKNGKPISNKELTVEIVLINIDIEEKVYSEEHHIITNKFGLFTLIIGKGIPDLGQDFNKIDWSSGSIKVVASIDFGNGLQQAGSVILQAVPYAFVADSALKAPRQTYKMQDLADVVTDSLRQNQVLSWSGLNWVPASVISISKINAANINLTGKLEITGKAKISDTLVVESLFSPSGMFNTLIVNENAEINKNLAVGKNLIVSGNLLSDTLQSKYFKVDKIEGYLSGRVSDISNHNVTEMQGIVDVGSGKIITGAERMLLNSLPGKMQADILIMEERFRLESDNRYAKDSIALIKRELENRSLRNEDSAIYNKIKIDSLFLENSVKKEENVRDSNDLHLFTLIKNHQEQLTKVENDVFFEKTTRQSHDSAIVAQNDSGFVRLNSGLLLESESRNKADLVLQQNIQKEQNDRKSILDSIYTSLKNDIDNNNLSDLNISDRLSSDSTKIRQLIKQSIRYEEITDSLINEKIKNNEGSFGKAIDTVKLAIQLESEERYVSDSVIKKKMVMDSTSFNNALASNLLKSQKSDSMLSDSISLVKDIILENNISLTDSIENEKQRRKETAEKIMLKIIRDSSLAGNNLLEEIINRKTADSLIYRKITDESLSRDTISKNIRQEIENERVKRQILDELLTNKIKEDSLDISLKLNDVRALNYSKLNILQSEIENETTERIESANNILDSLNSERQTRNNSENSIKNKIIVDSALLKQEIKREVSLRAHVDDSLSSALKTETEYRNSNYLTLTEKIEEEEIQRISNDNDLSYRIISDSLRKENSRDLLDNRINGEIATRKSTDTKLEHLIKDNRSLKLSGTTFNLTEAYDTLSVNLSSINTDNQAISYDNTNHILKLVNGGSVDLTPLLNDSDANSQNELNTNISLNGTVLEITDAGGTKSVDLSQINTDNQKISYNPQTHTLTLQNGGSINLSGFFNSSVVLDGAKLEITDGDGTKTLDLSPINTDNQQLFLNGNSLSISEGNTVLMPYASHSQSGMLKSSDWNNFNSKPGPGLNSGQIWIGNSENMAEAVALCGDASLVNSGAFTISNNAITASKIKDGAVTSEKLNSMGAISGQVLRYNGNFWQPSVDNSEYIAGVGISINGNMISNISQDKIVNLTGSTGIGITGSYPDFIITNSKPNNNHTGDVTGSDFLTISPNAVTSAKIEDKAVNGSKINPMGATSGQVLKFNGAAWSPAIDSNSNYYAGSGVKISNSYIFNTAPDKIVVLHGENGISVSGEYPDFEISNSSPNANHTGDVTGESVLSISNKAVTTPKIADNSVTALKINQMGATSGQILKFNGVSWGPSADNNSVYTGSTGINVTGSVITNTQPDKIVSLTGGRGVEITGTYPDFTVTNSLPNVLHTGDVIGVDSLTIANNSINTPKILDGAVTNTKLDRMGAEEGQVLKWKSTHWVPSVANQTEYIAGEGIKITGTIVENTKPNENHNGDVTGWRTLTIANNSVTNSKILDSAVTTSKLAFRAITGEKIDNNAVTNAKILNGSISTDKLADRAVTKDKINSNSIDSTKIIAGSVSEHNLGHYSVTEDKISSMAITTEKIRNNAITSEKIPDKTILTSDINDEAVTEAKIAINAISTLKINDEAVTLAKLSKNGAGNGKVIKFMGNNWVPSDENTYTQGPGIKITGSVISNTAPNATHTGEVVGSAALMIAERVIDSSNIKSGSISYTNIQAGAIRGDRINSMGAYNSQVLTYNKGTWVPGDNNSHTHLSIQISDATSINANNKLVLRDASGNFSAGTITATLIGKAASASKADLWTTPRRITLQGDVTGYNSIDGSNDIIISNKVSDNSHKHLSSNISDATELNNGGSIVKRDNNGNFNANIIHASLEGTASTAVLANKATKADAADISNRLTNSLTINLGNELSGNTTFYGNEGSVTLNATVSSATSANNNGTIVRRSTNGDFSARYITADLNGNASTSGKWQTSRTLSLTGGVSGSKLIDGSGNVDIACIVTDNSHNHTSSNVSDATYENIADKIVKRNTNGFFNTGGINVGDLNTAHNSNFNVYGITNFYSKLKSSSNPSIVTISQCDDNSSDISPGFINTGHLGYLRRWKDIFVDNINSNSGTIGTLYSTTARIKNLNSTSGTIATLNSTNGTIDNFNATTATIGGVVDGGSYTGNLTVKGVLNLTVGVNRSGDPVTLSFYHGPDNNGSEMKIIPSTSYSYLGSPTSPFYAIYASDGVVHTSDRRIKENIIPVSGSLEKTMKLQGVKYDLKRDFCPGKNSAAGKNQIGFIAQEVLEVIPQAVVYDSSSNLYGIKYDIFIPVLTEAIKEQQNIIDSLRNENKANEVKISNLEKRLLEIERRLK